MDNLFVRYLDLLGVKHTKMYATELYRSNPDKHNLYGLSSLLDKYQVDNEGLLLERSKLSLSKIEPPFIAEMKDGFGIVSKKDNEKIELIISNDQKSLTYDEFIKNWSGIVLLSEPHKRSGEPNYEKNRKATLLKAFEKIFFYLLLILFSIFCGIQNGVFDEYGLIFSLILNLAGFAICLLLINHQIDSSSGHIDRLCSLFGEKKNCSHILESDASKIFGYITWSEIGISFYISNLWLILCFAKLYPYLSIISVCSLLFTFWSLYYQKYKAKEWCFSCLLVLFCLWTLFLNNLIFGLIRMPDFNYKELASILFIYAIPLFCIHLLLPIFIRSSKLTEVSNSFKQLKSDEDIFRSLLKSSRKYHIDKDLGISWGNNEAKNTVTVISNPYCKPCGEIHSKLKEILNNTGAKYRIQYIFVTYNQTLEKSIALFTAIRQNSNLSEFEFFLDHWFTSDDKEKQNIMNKKYPFDLDEECWKKSIKEQKKLVKSIGIMSTPSLFFNGYLLPNKYEVEDLSQFYNIDINE